MDEEEKVFDIGLFVILLIVAAANDILEIIFDILDFTGVGLAGEGIMEPINLVLDAFFTAVFIWKTGFGSESTVQFIDDLLQLVFIPGRTISVFAGMWIANHPKSTISTVVNEASGLTGDAIGKAASSVKKEVGEAEKVAEKTSQEVSSVEGKASAGASGSESEQAEKKKDSSSSTSSGGARSSEEYGGGNSGGNDQQQEGQEEDLMASREEGNPVENLQQDLLETTNEEKPVEPEEERPNKKVIDIRTKKPVQNTKPSNQGDSQKAA